MLELPFNELHEQARQNPEKYWDEIASDFYWHEKYTSVLENKNSFNPKWFVNGKINMCYNCLDKHIKDGHGDQIALSYENLYNNTKIKYTYNELYEKVCHLAGCFKYKFQLTMPDRAFIYMPKIPECLITMLALSRLGIAYCIVFGGFPEKEVSFRIKQVEPKVVITCNYGYSADGQVLNFKNTIDKALGFIKNKSDDKVEHILVYNRLDTLKAKLTDARDIAWEDALSDCLPFYDSIAVPSDHPIFILYTSGTTGDPKGLVFTTGGFTVGSIISTKYGFDLDKHSRWWSNSNYGWIVGQTLMSYSVLLYACEIVLIEGDSIATDNEECFARVLNDYQVNFLFITPTLMRVLRKNCKNIHQINFPDLKYIGIGGEIIDSNLKQWITETFRVPNFNSWGQTELGGPGALPGLGFKDGHVSFRNDNTVRPLPGINPVIYEKSSGQVLTRQTSTGIVGRILFELPMTPSAAVTLLKENQRFYDIYFKKHIGYYDTMDVGEITEWGSLKIASRDDDIIQIGAVRVSAGSLEEITNQILEIEDSAFVGLDDDIYGQVPFGFLILKKEYSKVLSFEIIATVAEKICEFYGEISHFHNAITVEELPRTRTGKIHRKSLAQMINRRDYQIPPVIDNAEVYPIIYKALMDNGIKANLPEN